LAGLRPHPAAAARSNSSSCRPLWRRTTSTQINRSLCSSGGGGGGSSSMIYFGTATMLFGSVLQNQEIL
jgi:hypothetical protein